MPPSLVPVVSLLSRRSRVAFEGHDELLSSRESPLSTNSVVGWSVNVPIATTCSPTKVCARGCYAASNLLAATPALLRQNRVQRTIDADPEAFARRVCAEYDRRGLTFLRWNGVGDLEGRAVEAINWIAAHRPDVTLWVVTRKPAEAARIEQAPRVFVHFSLDADSLDRREKFLSLAPRTSNYFFSWQCERGMGSPPGAPVSVVFAHRYKVPPGAYVGGAASCPLNTTENADGECGRCRRCFDGTAVTMRSAEAGPTL